MVEFESHPVTLERWADLEKLFGKRGAYGGCWCMWFRIPRAQFSSQQGEGNRQALRQIVESGQAPGLLGYINGEPAGWISIQPREAFPQLDRSRIMKRVDDEPVWSIVCFYIHKQYRKQGLMLKLIRSAVDWAVSQGAIIVEAYPVDPGENGYPDVYAYTGLAAAFQKLGFVEVARRSEKRPVMRYITTT